VAKMGLGGHGGGWVAKEGGWPRRVVELGNGWLIRGIGGYIGGWVANLGGWWQIRGMGSKEGDGWLAKQGDGRLAKQWWLGMGG
jgi:hypothetical protein